MNAIIIEDKVDLTDQQKNIIQEKLVDHIERLLTHFSADLKDPTIRVEYLDKKRGFTVNFNLWLPGKKDIYAEETNDNLLLAVTNLREEVERQIKEYREELSSR